MGNKSEPQRQGNSNSPCFRVLQPVQVGVALSGEMQKQRLQCVEFLPIMPDDAVVRERRQCEYKACQPANKQRETGNSAKTRGGHDRGCAEGMI